MTGLTPMTYSLIFGTNSEYKSLLIVQKTLQLLSVSLSLPLLMHNYQEKKRDWNSQNKNVISGKKKICNNLHLTH